MSNIKKRGGKSTPKKNKKENSSSPRQSPSPKTPKTTTPLKKDNNNNNTPFHSRRPSATFLSNPSPLRDTPLGEFLEVFKAASNQWVARYVYVSFALIIRAAVGLGPYSGYKTEPMHGDFEAQRHWMEMTVHVPMKEWYYHDLEWWGLDYPPLTAFHSWLLGFIGKFLNPEWFELYTSRGTDDYNLKYYMRGSVLLFELMLYIPAVIWFVRWYGKNHSKISSIDQSIASAAILFQPALILIDHGHFQYNSIMLGLALLAIVNLNYSNKLAASVLFTLSLCFKQMALYYAPIIFAYLLGCCVFPRINILRLLAIGITVLVTFGIMLGPFIITGGLTQLYQIAFRVFPFTRGLFEDKVANIWCCINTFVKIRNTFTADELQKISLFATLGSILPAMALIFYFPRKHLLPWAFSAGAWGFFLFSFQVHEKTALVPLMPATLLLASTDPNIISMITWINNIATFSLWPLLKREELVLQYVTILFCWNWLIGTFYPPSRMNKVFPENLFWKLVHIGSYIGVAIVHLAEVYLPKNLYIDRYPDLMAIANVSLCTPCFVLFWLWNLYQLYNQR